MKLYDFAFSPNCRKVRALAYELGISLEFTPVDLVRGEQRGAPFLGLNPNGRVPVLVDEGFVLWESTAIMRYLAAKSDGRFIPTTAQASAEMDRWLAWQLAHLAPAMSRVAFERIVKKLTGQGQPDAAIVAAGSADFAALSAILEAALEGREYIAGALSLADFALGSHYSLAETCGLELAPFARVRDWLARILERASMRRALADAHMTMRSADAA